MSLNRILFCSLKRHLVTIGMSSPIYLKLPTEIKLPTELYRFLENLDFTQVYLIFVIQTLSIQVKLQCHEVDWSF